MNYSSFTDAIISNAFNQFIKSPTRCNNISYLLFCNVIVLFLTSQFLNHVTHNNPSDHSTLHFTINCNCTFAKKISRLNFAKTDLDSLSTNFANFVLLNIFTDNIFLIQLIFLTIPLNVQLINVFPLK